MTSLFDVGKSGIQAYRQSLAVTGQNIANMNTEGYSRREATLQEVTASQGGITSLSSQAGLGVRVADIRRSFDEFLFDRARMTAGSFEQAEKYLEQLEQLENILLPSNADLGSQIGRFFAALGDVASSPGDLAPRVVAVEEGDALASSFNSLSNLLDKQQAGSISLAQDAVTAVNLLTGELGDVNSRILSSGQSGQSPNSLLDLRDRLIDDIAKFTDITVNYSDRGVASISLGSSGVGPVILDQNNSGTLGFSNETGVVRYFLKSGGNSAPTSQIKSGVLAGLADAYAMVREVIKEVNHLANLVSTEFNTQHKMGVDLDGNSGRQMFSTNGLLVEKSPSSTSSLVVELQVTDLDLLPENQLDLTYNSVKKSWVLTGLEIKEPLTGKDKIVGPGFVLEISGTPTDGDYYTLKRNENAASTIQFLLKRPQEIAAASAKMVFANNENLSESELKVQLIKDDTALIQKPISGTLLNSQSPVEATEFLRNGLVATIPAGTENIELSSFAKQSSAKFLLSADDLASASQLKFELEGASNNGPHIFDISYHTAFPMAAVDKFWSSGAEIVEALNNGVLRSNNNLSLADIGMFMAASSGAISMVSASGDFKTSGDNRAQIISGAGVVAGILTEAVDASDIQVFTREGRHIAGSSLNTSDINSLLTIQNGFSASATYVGDYLNRPKDMYRGSDISISEMGGHHTVDTGSNGTGASALGGFGVVPSNATVDRDFTVKLSNGEERTVAISAGSHASDVAAELNKSFNDIGARADAELTVELFSFQQSGQLKFELASMNDEPVTLQASVNPNNLSALADAFNRETINTGVKATLSLSGERIFLSNSSGDDIVFKSLNEGAPLFSSRVINKGGQKITEPIVLGGAGEGIINAARFSGVVTVSSSDSFELDAGTQVLNSTRDPHLNSLVEVSGTSGGESKVIRFNVNSDTDRHVESFDGSQASAASATYSMTLPVVAEVYQIERISAPTIPTISAGDKFKVTINGTEIETAAAVNETGLSGIVEMLNGANAAPLVNGVFAVGDTDDITFTYNTAGPFAGTISKLFFLDDSAGLGYDLGTGVGAQDVSGVSSISYSASAKSSDFNPVNLDALNAELISSIRAQAPMVSLSGAQAPSQLPAEGDSLALSLAGDLYRLTMTDGEIVVSGGEVGRLNAYFDPSGYLQIFGGGVLSGEPIKIVDNSVVGNNEQMAERFGVSERVSRITSQQVTLSASMPELSLEFDGVQITVDLALDGTITKSPNINGLSISWQPVSGSNGRVVIEFDDTSNTLKFDSPQESLGFKIANLQTKIAGDGIQVNSTSGSYVGVEADASSIATQKIKILGLPPEDLIVLVTGSGARAVGGAYDQPVPQMSQESLVLEMTSQNSQTVEILDLVSGHSIGTRQLDVNGSTSFAGYEFELRGSAVNGDRFTIQPNTNPSGDNRNLNKMLTFQVSDTNGTGSGGFQKVFNNIVASVGAAVNSNKISYEAAEANRDAALESKSEFSGVNLDTEAAALLQYQQAYQASARVLSTARELFQTLIDVV